MPARKSSHTGRKSEYNSAAAPKAGADEAATARDGSAAAHDEVADVPMNRAARRAKGKGASQPRPVGKIVPGRVNMRHGSRSYTNRRSG